MKRFWTFGAAAVLALVMAAQAQLDANYKYPKMIAMMIDAAGCGPCRTLESKLSGIRDGFLDEDILFVTMDVTTEATRHQANMLAAAIGIEFVLHQNWDEPGKLLIVDPSRVYAVKTITADMEPDEIAAAIRETLAE